MLELQRTLGNRAVQRLTRSAPVRGPTAADGALLAEPPGLDAPGRPLPAPVRAKMEAFFQADFSGVRVHVGPQAPAIGADALTLGRNLFFAPGQYEPHTARGQQTLGHELTSSSRMRGRSATRSAPAPRWSRMAVSRPRPTGWASAPRRPRRASRTAWHRPGSWPRGGAPVKRQPLPAASHRRRGCAGSFARSSGGGGGIITRTPRPRPRRRSRQPWLKILKKSINKLITAQDSITILARQLTSLA
jgi:hypothetical protein